MSYWQGMWRVLWLGLIVWADGDPSSSPDQGCTLFLMLLDESMALIKAKKMPILVDLETRVSG